MTELETIKRAKMYMDKLANGINPIDDTPVPDAELVNNVRLSRCFFFVSDVLRQVIENGGIKSATTSKKPQKLPFAIPFERRDSFAFSETPIPISELANRLNAMIDGDNMRRISASKILVWLEKAGALCHVTLPSGQSARHPTQDGISLGIALKECIGSQGPYQVVVYNIQAQHFILDNLDAIIELPRENAELQGTPWSRSHDDCLIDLFQKNVPLNEIAVTLKRNTTAIRARLKKLGLIEKRSDI